MNCSEGQLRFEALLCKLSHEVMQFSCVHKTERLLYRAFSSNFRVLHVPLHENSVIAVIGMVEGD